MKVQQQEVLQQVFNQTRKGTVLEILEDGLVSIQDKADTDAEYPCYFLRTSAGSLPQLHPQDLVIYRVPELDEKEGVVLGVIGKYTSYENKVAKQIEKCEAIRMTTLEDEVLHIKADEGLVIECGKSSIILSKDGKLQIKGVEILSHAKGTNKIKGAGVNIN